MISRSKQCRNPPRLNPPLHLRTDAHAGHEAAVAANKWDCPKPAMTPSASVGAGIISRVVGVPCLVPTLRIARLPKDFKGPRKVANYTADLPPEAWIESN